ncbi:MAG: MGMT family protein [Fimbriimonadaceae bacterium]
MSGIDELWILVRKVPRGRVVGYGTLGRALPNPVSGLIVGKWMARAPEDVPWWRVVAFDGRLPVYKRDPGLAQTQTARLRSEGVAFLDDGRVDMSFAWEPET